ncbi:MAG: hypothetical protein PHT79_04230 [Syntrophomonadaceae bacterium]|nr:hypothetical protein [Syntrophomonadaceae bacterium]MDD3889652.1 hypothetical protein [Syntrophomonadaceae bacterium]MDD4548950.1 hypothetical protein [Syntrophomonadaceae bacterium]
MKVYHTCDYCQMIYNISEVEGPEGAIEINGVCEECSQEIGLNEPPISNIRHYYN